MKYAYQKHQPDQPNEQTLTHEEKESVRINKFLAASGFCSRRGADKLVEAGSVTIDGQLATSGSQVSAGQCVMVDGQPVGETPTQHVYIALNKPVGIACTVERDVEGNIADFMRLKTRIFPIGRLDKDSTGLILLTSDGDIVNKILRAENNHEKEYLVQVNRNVDAEFLRALEDGVEITNMRTKQRQTTKPCRVQRVDSRRFRIVLTQGLNRQIRRMCTELGYRVDSLKRLRVMNIELGDLQLGQWRYLTQAELDEMAQCFEADEAQ